VARLARVVIPGLAHHVTQRGNGRRRVFFSDQDYALYLRLLASACVAERVSCLAFCLMPNHVHLLLVPDRDDGLRRSLAVVHRAYAGCLNARRRVTGHFWQGRYGSVPMDDAHLYEALRYVLLNPVRANLVRDAAAWRWSSIGAYLTGADDGITSVARMLTLVPDMMAYLAAEPDAARLARLRGGQTIGRPAADADFVRALERKTGRCLQPRKRGPTRLPRVATAGRGTTGRSARG
jgi:putative transposase